MNKRTGTLVPKPSGFFARVWVGEEREWVELHTKSRATALRRLAKFIADVEAGKAIVEARATAAEAESYRAFTSALHETRRRHVKMAPGEQAARERYIYPTIGELPLTRITDDHVREVLEGARNAGLGRETVHKIRAIMRRDLKRARMEKLIEGRPAEDVAIPEGLKKDKRPFVSPTDGEIARFLAAPKGDLELKMLVMVSRTEGGMRTAEIMRWDWSMLDVEGFAVCTIARAKTGDVQTLEVPEVLRPFLRAWWARAGKPVAGPMFPVRRGRRAGQTRQDRGTSFAYRMRRDFFRAGVVRLPPIVDTDGKATPNPGDPLYFDTPVSRRMNFHSLRRAYDRALAGAGVNIQTAMALSAHSEPKTHMGYVRELEVMRPVPVAALPAIDAGLALRLLSPAVTYQSPAVTRGGERRGLSTERDTGFEPATFSLGS